MTAIDFDLEVTAEDIAALLTFDIELTDSDRNIIYYVSGAIAHSVVDATKCGHCKEVLLAPSTLQPLELTDDLAGNSNTAAFLNSIN